MRIVHTCHSIITTTCVAIIKLSFKHRLHFCKLYQRVESFVVLASIICKDAWFASIAYDLVVVSENAFGRLSTLHESVLDSNIIDVIHLFHLVTAMVVMCGFVCAATIGELGALHILIV